MTGKSHHNQTCNDWDVSSVGLERLLDRQEVTGSIPVRPTDCSLQSYYSGHMFYTYVLYSRHHNKVYIGFTSNPDARLIHHNHPQNKGWTAKFKPWEIIHIEQYEYKNDAMNREKQLKSSRGRQFIKSLLQSQ